MNRDRSTRTPFEHDPLVRTVKMPHRMQFVPQRTLHYHITTNHGKRADKTGVSSKTSTSNNSFTPPFPPTRDRQEGMPDQNTTLGEQKKTATSQPGKDSRK